MEKIVEHGLLYDFYGELLTEHQRQIYEDAVYHDMSLAEIADIQGISRQGVHDLIRRCDRILEQYEVKLGLVKKFALIKEKVQRIDALANELMKQEDCGPSKKRLAEQEGCGSLEKKLLVQEGCDALERETSDINTAAERLAAIRKLSGEIIEEL